MQAALRLPESGPATGARVLANLNGACAVSAADTRVIAVVQNVVRQIICAHVMPDSVRGPIRERIQFDQAEVSVPFKFFCPSARWCLIAADARNPRVEFGNLGLERIDFSYLAAEIWLPTPEGFAGASRLLRGGKSRTSAFDLNAVPILDTFD